MFISRGKALRAAVLLGLAVAIGAAGENVAVATIPAFNQVFDNPSGLPYRPVHTKGLLVQGVFLPSAEASTLTKAALFGGDAVPIIVRLSNFFGRPNSPDAGPLAAPRGMAIKFTLPDGSDSDLVAHSYNGFPAATPGEFLDFLHALAAGDGQPPPGTEGLAAFLAGHPRARLFLDTPKPAPVSWANEGFYGVNSFRFIDALGRSRYGRYRIMPSAGEARLSDEQATEAAPDYLSREMATRLSRGPVSWHLVVQLAGDEDDIADGSIAWPATRPTIELGLIRIDRLVADSLVAEHDLMFSPLNLVEGIEPSSDPMLAARSRAYGASYRLRTR